MKSAKKLLSLFLAIIMCFGVCIPAGAEDTADDMLSPEDYAKYIQYIGLPVVSTETFGVFLNILKGLISLVTGEEVQVNKFNVNIDDVLLDISAEICEESGLDLGLIADNIPDINKGAYYFKDKYEINTTEFRKARYEKRDEYLANGNPIMASVCHAIGAYMSIIQEMNIYTEPTKDPDVIKVMLHLTYEDGTVETHDAGLFINLKTGECTNEEGTGMFGSGYNFNIQEMMVYTTVDCWMRNFGFCLFYDVFANLNPISYSYVTRRFKFEYDGLEWMIQIWKGNYFISNGGEVGIYNRDPATARGTFYNCASADQELPMSIQVLIGDKLLVDRPLQKHWWMCGFHIGTMRYLPSLLTLKTSIVMPNEEMLQAFTEAIDNNVMNDVSYTVDGLQVNITW